VQEKNDDEENIQSSPRVKRSFLALEPMIDIPYSKDDRNLSQSQCHETEAPTRNTTR
jgi:hypothetical protein